MKTKEEMDKIYLEVCKDSGSKEIASEYCGFIKGYTQCQQDMTKELYEFGKLVLDTFHSEGKTHSGKDRLARVKFDEWFNQVNKQD